MPSIKEKRAPSEEDILIQSARESLGVYVGVVHRTDDGRFAIPPKHLREVVIPAIEDDSLRDTVIIAPPGSIKTNTMIGACAWWLGQDPTQHVAYVCNNSPEAVKRSLAIRDIIEFSPEYHAIFPAGRPNKNRGWAADSWYLERPNFMDKNPSLAAFGVGGGLGARLHKLVLDDIADDDNQKTDLQRKGLHKWLGETIKTRLDAQHGRAIMICTRWHEDDPAAYAIERGWTVVRIPAITEDGESYWPEFHPLKYLACPNDEHNLYGQCCMKKELGTVGFARQYMGVVQTDDSSIFKRNWWRYYQRLPEQNLPGAITIDTAGWDTNKPTGDFACLAAAVSDGFNVYWLDVQRGRWDFNEVERRALYLQEMYGLRIAVEDTPVARPLIQSLQKVTWGVTAYPTRSRSKYNRAEAVSPYVEAGNCFLPEGAPWVAAFIDEHAVFPNGKNDDQVDTTTMLLNTLLASRRPKRKDTQRQPYRQSLERMTA